MIDLEQRKKLIKFKAVALLASRERSRLGLSRKLKELYPEEFDKDLIKQVIEELEDKKYLSDERFARIQVLTKSSRYGDQRLGWELRRQGVDSEIIKEALESNETSELERARMIWDRKFGEKATDPKERARQVRFLASRGFSFRTIEKVIQCNLDEEDY